MKLYQIVIVLLLSFVGAGVATAALSFITVTEPARYDPPAWCHNDDEIHKSGVCSAIGKTWAV